MQVVIDHNLCDPAKCEEGRCAARKSCPPKAIYQEERGDKPFLDGGRCNGCAKCVPFCKAKAIKVY